MLFDNSVHPAEIQPLFDRFLNIAPWPLWRKRFRAFKAWSHSSPLQYEYTLQRYPIEIQMMLIDDGRLYSGGLPPPSEDAVASRFFSFVSMVSRVHQRLSVTGKATLEGMIADGLKSDKGLAPVAFEFRLAGLLMGRGWDVVFNDLETGGGFDFLIEADGVKMEVECKHVSPDIGRQVHRRQVYDFLGGLWERLHKIARNRQDGLVARVVIPGRFPTSQAGKAAIADLLLTALEAEENQEEVEIGSVYLTKFLVEESPFSTLATGSFDQGAARRYVDRISGSNDRETILVADPNGGVVSITLESAKPDTVMKSIIDRLKDASKDQLTGQYPGFLCIHLEDMSAEDFGNLASAEAEGATGIQIGSSYLLERRPHVYGLTYFASGSLTRRQALTDAGYRYVVAESGTTYSYRNQCHPQFADPRYRVF